MGFYSNLFSVAICLGFSGPSLYAQSVGQCPQGEAPVNHNGNNIDGIAAFFLAEAMGNVGAIDAIGGTTKQFHSADYIACETSLKLSDSSIDRIESSKCSVIKLYQGVTPVVVTDGRATNAYKAIETILSYYGVAPTETSTQSETNRTVTSQYNIKNFRCETTQIRRTNQNRVGYESHCKFDVVGVCNRHRAMTL